MVRATTSTALCSCLLTPEVVYWSNKALAMCFQSSVSVCLLMCDGGCYVCLKIHDILNEMISEHSVVSCIDQSIIIKAICGWNHEKILLVDGDFVKHLENYSYLKLL